MSSDHDFLKRAIELSKESVKKGGYAVGAVVVRDGVICGEGCALTNVLRDVTMHAEVAALRDAQKRANEYRFEGGTVYTSLEPCIMCYGACSRARIVKVVYAIKKDRVDQKNFVVTLPVEEINKYNPTPLEIVHLSELEKEALSIFNALNPEVK